MRNRPQNDACQQPELIGYSKHQESPLGPFLKSHNEELLENAEKDRRLGAAARKLGGSVTPALALIGA